MLNLKAHEQEVDPTNNHILEVVLGFGVLKLNMQAVLDSNVHLDRAVGLWRHAIGVHPQILLADDVGHAPGDRHAHEVAQLDVDSIV